AGIAGGGVSGRVATRPPIGSIMRMQGKQTRFRRRPALAALAAIGEVATVAGMSLTLVLPAQAQFWGPWANRPRAPVQRQQPQQQYNPFGGVFGPGSPSIFQPRREREEPVDNSRAPAAQRKPDTNTSIVVVGDAMADWLAYGLEDAFSENPD